MALYIKQGSVWIQVEEKYFHDGEIWKELEGMHAHEDDAWRLVFRPNCECNTREVSCICESRDGV